MAELLSRKDAIATSKKTYTLCNTCMKCGTAEKYSTNSNCVFCARERAKKQWSDPAYVSKDTERRKARRHADPEYRARKNATNKKWSDANPEKMSLAIKNWTERNKKRVREKSNAWRRDAYKNNPEYRMRCAMSAMVKRIANLSGEAKTSKSELILGYSKSEFVSHIEAQFTKKMNWNNYGDYWHIDHIIPVSHFFKIGETRPEVINSLSNLRPLEAIKNQIKADSLEFLL